MMNMMNSMRMKQVERIASGIAAIGAINWGLWAIFRFDAVKALFGWAQPLQRLFYIVVGAAGILSGYRLLAKPQKGRLVFLRRAA